MKFAVVRIAALAAVSLALCGSAMAAPPTWAVDKAASKLGFKSTFSGEGFEGVFRRWESQIQFDPKDLAASKAVITVDVASASTGDGSRDEAIPSDDWFAARKFPQATFVTRSFKSLGGNRYEAVGDLTIRGISKPLVLPFTLAIAGDTARMNSSVVLNRSAFGVGQGEFKSAETVPLNVTVDIALTAHKR